VTYDPVNGILANPRGRPAFRLEGNLEDEAKDLYKANKLTGSKKLLHIILWASDEEIRQLKMHPHCMVVDTTFKTNKSKKEVLTIAFRDGNDEAFHGGRAFLPSAQKWIFALLFNSCLKMFWGEAICKSVRLCLTDGDSNEYEAFLSAVRVRDEHCCQCCGRG